MTTSDPQAEYAQVFGEEEKKILASPNTKDDAVFAAKLVARALELHDAPDLQRFLWQRAYELALRDADATDIAIEACKRLLAVLPVADKAIWQTRLADSYQAQYRRATGPKRFEAGSFLVGALIDEARLLNESGKLGEGVKRLKEALSIATTIRSPLSDEVAVKIKDIQARQQAIERLEKLKIRLDAGGGDLVLLEQLIVGYLLEADDLTTATKLAASHPDKSWESMLGLMAQDPTSLEENDLLGLSNWFAKLGERQPLRIAALIQSQNYCVLFLSTHPAKDAARLRAEALLEQNVKRLSSTAIPADSKSKIVIWNTHHGAFANHGTTQVNVALVRNGLVIWRKDSIRLDWSAKQDSSISLFLPTGLSVDAVRVEINAWIGDGGGLSEIEVWESGKNMALGAKAIASASLPEFECEKLTDGIISSNEWKKGYWLLPNKTPGWATIDVKGKLPGIGLPSVKKH